MAWKSLGFWVKIKKYGFEFFELVGEFGSHGLHGVDSALVLLDDLLDLVEGGGSEGAGDEGEHEDKGLGH